MIVGVTGHQTRDGIDWTWVQTELLAILTEVKISVGVTSLAAGTDQVFAAAALQLGSRLISVIPFERYEDVFEGDSRRMYRFMRDHSEQVNLSLNLPQEQAFLEAGKYVADRCELLVALWDGQPAEGVGGTADIVAYARSRARRIIWMEPITRKVHRERGA